MCLVVFVAVKMGFSMYLWYVKITMTNKKYSGPAYKVVSRIPPLNHVTSYSLANLKRRLELASL